MSCNLHWIRAVMTFRPSSEFHIFVTGPLECGSHSLSDGGAVSVLILCPGGLWRLAGIATGRGEKGTGPGRPRRPRPALFPSLIPRLATNLWCCCAPFFTRLTKSKGVCGAASPLLTLCYYNCYVEVVWVGGEKMVFKEFFLCLWKRRQARFLHFIFFLSRYFSGFCFVAGFVCFFGCAFPNDFDIQVFFY